MFNNSLTRTGKIIRNIIIFIIFIVLMLVLNSKKTAENGVPIEDENIEGDVVSLCFYKKDVLDEMYGRYTLRLNLAGEKVDGELNFIPAQKDSKVGAIEGTVSEVDRATMSRVVTAWWDTFGEGIRATEEIKILFGEGTASIGSGLLKDRGDGVYVYEDPGSIVYTLHLSDVGCDTLDEIENVDEYLRANISTLSPVKAVLGGTWYVFTFDVDTNTNTGTVVYEDGHIQEKKSFTYTTDDQNKIVSMQLK